jgi:hypothetical protein
VVAEYSPRFFKQLPEVKKIMHYLAVIDLATSKALNIWLKMTFFNQGDSHLSFAAIAGWENNFKVYLPE